MHARTHTHTRLPSADWIGVGCTRERGELLWRLDSTLFSLRRGGVRWSRPRRWLVWTDLPGWLAVGPLSLTCYASAPPPPRRFSVFESHARTDRLGYLPDPARPTLCSPRSLIRPFVRWEGWRKAVPRTVTRFFLPSDSPTDMRLIIKQKKKKKRRTEPDDAEERKKEKAAEPEQAAARLRAPAYSLCTRCKSERHLGVGGGGGGGLRLSGWCIRACSRWVRGRGLRGPARISSAGCCPRRRRRSSSREETQPGAALAARSSSRSTAAADRGREGHPSRRCRIRPDRPPPLRWVDRISGRSSSHSGSQPAPVHACRPTLPSRHATPRHAMPCHCRLPNGGI